MGSPELTYEEKIQRFLYTCSYFGAFITGNADKHICKFTTAALFQYIQTSPKDFLNIISSVSGDPLLVRRLSLYYIMAEALKSEALSEEVKLEIKDTVLKTVKSDEEFFDFVKFYTLLAPKGKQKLTTSLKKIICKFYQMKKPEDFARCVTEQDSHHSWTHKDLLKLIHYKSPNIGCEIVLKYVLFGVKGLPASTEDEFKAMVDYIRKNHEMRTTTDVKRAATLVEELNGNVEQVNSKLNKNEEVWLAALPTMNTREILRSLYRFYSLGFLKPHGQFQATLIQILTNVENVRKCNLHPVEVFIYMKVFEKGGKAIDPKLLEYLHKREIREETLKKLITPVEPKCKPVMQAINRCLTISYDNVLPTGKRFLITVDVTDKLGQFCFHNKRIPCFEAAATLIRFLAKVEKTVMVAVFKQDKIVFVDVTKGHSLAERLQELRAEYVIPAAPIAWASYKKKQIDVFINFMSCGWLACVPAPLRESAEKVPESLNKYSKKMKLPEARLVKIFLDGPNASYTENPRNILSIAGFSGEVPRILESFCRGHFC